MKPKKGVVLLIDEIDREWLRLMKEAKLDVLGIHEIVTEKPNSVQKVLNRIAEPAVRRMLDEYEQSGISLEYELHALEWLLPRDMFDKSPEFFRVGDDGERKRELNCCVSNSDALEIISENARKLAKLLGQSSHNYCLWPDDSFHSLCKCEKCRALRTGADHNIIMMNAIIRGLRAYDSDAKLSCIAYADFLDVPELKPDEGLFLEFAPMQRNQRVPMRDPNDAKNSEYRALLTQLLNIFEPSSSRVLEYWLDNAFNSGFVKPPKRLVYDEEVVDDDIRFYTSLGFGLITTFGSYMGSDYRALYGDPPALEYGRSLEKNM